MIKTIAKLCEQQIHDMDKSETVVFELSKEGYKPLYSLLSDNAL